MPQSLPVSMSASAQLRTRVLKVVGWTLGSLTLAATVVRALVAPLYPQILGLGIALSLVLLALPFLGSVKHWSPRLGITVTLVFLTLVLSASYLAGGLRAPAIVFLVVVPLLGIVLVGRRFGIVLIVVVVAALAALLVLHRLAVVPETQLADWPLLFMRAFMLAVALLVVTAALAVYDRNSQDLMQQFHREALTDALTGLHNRRCLEVLFPDWVESARQRHQEVWLALIDVDHFKQINDSRGHDAGDRALRRVASTLHSFADAAGSSLVARMAGDEFVVLFAGARADLQAILERAQSVLAQSDNEAPALSISAGMVGLPSARSTTDKLLHELLARADAGLYRAKLSGRDRVVVVDDAGEASQRIAAPRDAQPSPTRLAG